MRNLPNIISALRILMVGVFAYYFAKAQYVACIITYITAFLSDLLDGWLARHNNWTTDLGKVLDPLADKLMLITAVICFYSRGWLPFVMFFIIVLKETAMVVGGALLFKKDVVVYADWFGKFASGFFTASVITTLFKQLPAPFFQSLGSLNLFLFGVAILLALIAVSHYAKIQVFDRFKEKDA